LIILTEQIYTQNNRVSLNIAKQYTETPGGRYRNDGKYSGEDFRETLLKKKYEDAKESARTTKDSDLKEIAITSNESPLAADRIKQYISDGLG
jgi:hypothetical protein